jgi:hypothetical protein
VYNNITYPITLIGLYYYEPKFYIANLFSSTLTYFYVPAIEEQSFPDIKSISLTIFPNPAKSFLTLRCPLTAYNQTLKLFDITGKLIKQVKIFRQEITVPLNGVKSGIYFVEVGSITKKLIVTR